MNPDYVHGYSERESSRLADQANTLTNLLHSDTFYPPGSAVLEAGCGIGAQTITLAQNSPHALFTSIDISEKSLAHAKQQIQDMKINNVSFRQADIFNLPFKDETFDHIFVCFVLEHLPNPEQALSHIRRVLKPGGTITVIEGDHGSAYCHSESIYAKKAIQCLIDLQHQAGGNSLIGRELYPLLDKSGFKNIRVSPRMVYVDSSKPELVEGFTKKTFTAMVEGVKDAALSSKMIDKASWDKGIADLYRTAEYDGTFCYTFFKGVGIR